jgi:hypothetical protein
MVHLPSFQYPYSAFPFVAFSVVLAALVLPVLVVAVQGEIVGLCSVVENPQGLPVHLQLRLSVRRFGQQNLMICLAHRLSG